MRLAPDRLIVKTQVSLEKELIIRTRPEGAEIALLENKKLVELHHQHEDSSFNVGDIYLGRVKRLNPGLNAAFIDVGFKKDAFLHYTDLSPNIKTVVKFTGISIHGKRKIELEKFRFEPQIVKTGKINNALIKKTALLVQILKEPISTKGPRLTCEITLSGRYLVLAPFGNTVGISRKITSADERKRLIRLIESIRPKNFGIVIRTVAENKTVADLHEDLTDLVNKWKTVVEKLNNQHPPKQILGEIDKTSGLLRDILNDSFSKVVVNDKAMLHEVKDFVGKIEPQKAKIVQAYNGKRPIFETFGVAKQIKSLFGKTVTMGSGAYLIIEHTEAMHVIDVNSGQKISNVKDQETNALNVNLEAAEEAARQMRLRDLGGIITIDFIDMKKPENKRKLVSAVRKAMKPDRAKHTILPLSKFGIMQITRQRVRPELNISTSEVCPACNGSGIIGPSLLVLDEIERKLDYLVNSQNKKNILLKVHPFTFAYLKEGIISRFRKWRLKYSRALKLGKDNDFHLMEFRFYDETGEEITLE